MMRTLFLGNTPADREAFMEQQACDLAAALHRLGGDAQLLKDMVGFFYEDAPVLLIRVRAAVAQGNAAETQLAAHSLKGLAANFDAAPTVHAALRLEQIGQSRDLSAAAAVLADLEHAVNRLSLELAAASAKL